MDVSASERDYPSPSEYAMDAPAEQAVTQEQSRQS